MACRKRDALLLIATVGMDVIKVLLERSLLRSGGSFRFPLFTVLMHQLVAFAILSCTGSVLRLWKPGPPWRSDGSHTASQRVLAAQEAQAGGVAPLFKLPPPRQSYSVAGFALLVALYGANTSLDELALGHLDGSTLKALRASKPLVVSLIGGAIYGCDRLSGRDEAVVPLRWLLVRALRLGAMCGVALGAALLYFGGSAESDAEGVALAAAATLASALHIMATAFMLRCDGERFFLSPPTLLLWLSMTWAAVLFPAVWIREGFARPLAAANRGGGATWSKLGGSAVVGGAKALLELAVIEHFGAVYAATLAVFKVPLMVGAEGELKNFILFTVPLHSRESCLRCDLPPSLTHMLHFKTTCGSRLRPALSRAGRSRRHARGRRLIRALSLGAHRGVGAAAAGPAGERR